MINIVEMHHSMIGWALVIGFALVLLVAFYDVPEKQHVFDLAFRFMRFGGAFAVLNI